MDTKKHCFTRFITMQNFGDDFNNDIIRMYMRNSEKNQLAYYKIFHYLQHIRKIKPIREIKFIMNIFTQY